MTNNSRGLTNGNSTWPSTLWRLPTRNTSDGTGVCGGKGTTTERVEGRGITMWEKGGSVVSAQNAVPTPIRLHADHVAVHGSSSESERGKEDTGGSGYGRRVDTGHRRAGGGVGAEQDGVGRPDSTGGTGSEFTRHTTTGDKGLLATQGCHAYCGKVRKDICGGRQEMEEQPGRTKRREGGLWGANTYGWP